MTQYTCLPYNLSVAIEFDSTKEARNRGKHGISMARAAELFEQPFRETEDLRAEYGERRFIAYGFIEARLFVCVYVWRGERRRIVSLREGQPEGDRCLPSDRARLASPRPVARPIGGDSIH